MLRGGLALELYEAGGLEAIGCLILHNTKTHVMQD